jgi:hypothetical protein
LWWIGIKGLVIYTGDEIIEEPDAVIPHVRICVWTAKSIGSESLVYAVGINDPIDSIRLQLCAAQLAQAVKKA